MAKGFIILTHGGANTLQNRNNSYVSEALHKAGYGTMAIDLLTSAEEKDYRKRLDIDLLTHRFSSVLSWAQQHKMLNHLPIGIFASTTGAASALRVAAEGNHQLKAVVSQGGRPDMALPELPFIKAPVLFIVGSTDLAVLNLNIRAFDRIRTKKNMQVIGEMAHRMDRKMSSNMVAQLALEWFENNFQACQNPESFDHAYHRKRRIM